MKFEKIHNKGQAQIFKNQYLEYLTKTHPLVIWGMYLPAIILLPYYASANYSVSMWQIILFFLAGIFFWTFFEYVMHRFIFHWVSDSPRARKITYVVHGNHHEFPRDRQRLFMPPVPGLLIACIIFLLFYLAINMFAFLFFPGFTLGYLLYGTMHYAIHSWRPPFNWMKAIWRNHHLHHYKSDSMGFGVSTNFWDRIFGTEFDLNKEKDDVEGTKKIMF
ncbi:MAG: sterol desaturase family protein [Ginsengibacter sp.]